jgi:phosphonate transport system substrate-binding protein
MKKILAVFLAMFCLCVFFLAGCRQTETAPPPEGGHNTLLIGLIPEQNIFKQLERHEPLTAYLSKESGINLKLIVLTRYGNVIDNFVSTGLDGAFFGSFTYAVAHARLGVEALARPEGEDGKSTYHGLILVRRGSGVENADHMKGKRFAFVDQGTTGGYLFPIRYLTEYGIGNYKTYLGEVYYTGTHEDAIYDVLNEKTDIAAAKNTVYERLAQGDSRIIDELTILARSPEVPENCLALRSNLSESTKSKLQSTMLLMHQDPAGREVLKKFGARKFIETRDGDYEAVYEYAREINLDLANFDY